MDLLLLADGDELAKWGALASGVSALIIALGKVLYDRRKQQGEQDHSDDDRSDRTNKETIKLLRADVNRLVSKLEAREAELLACREIAAELRAENAAMRRKLERSGDKSL